MTTGTPWVADAVRSPRADHLSTPERVLVRSPTSPPVWTEHCVDVRPAPVATFDGDRVRLSLTVSGTEGRLQVPWIDRPSLDGTVSSMLEWNAATFVRFAGRSACRRVLGAASTRAVERRLAAIAGRAEVPLVTWTTGPLDRVDVGPYDFVVERAPPGD